MNSYRRVKNLINRRLRKLLLRVFPEQLKSSDPKLVEQSTMEILLHLRRNYEQSILILKRLREQLDEQTTTDALTKLNNRKGMEELFKKQTMLLNRVESEPTVVTVLLIDLDRLKYINDTYGHHKGDEVIVAFANAIRIIFKRESDILCHLHGDEFLAILPGSSITDSYERAEEFLKCLEATPELIFPNFRVTASIGITMIELPTMSSHPTDTLSILMHEADIAMYHAKRSGRNRVVIYDPRMCLENDTIA